MRKRKETRRSGGAPRGTITPQQERFVAEYLIDLNATQAAIRAGYSEKTAYTMGPRLLGLPRVAAALQKAKEKREARTGITQDRVLEELQQLAFSDVTHYEVDGEGRVTLALHAPAGAMRAVSSIKRRIFKGDGGGVEVELKLWDKPGPLKLAGRHVGLFPDKVEVTGPNGGPIEHAVTKVEVVIVDPAGGA